MIKLEKIGYSLNDVAIVQEPESNIRSRKNVNPFITLCKKKSLPIFVAPMDSVTDENNYKIWQDNNVCPVIPRTVSQRLSLKERLRLAKSTFVSFSLEEVELLYKLVDNNNAIMHISHEYPIYVCIDIAQGTMEALYDICEKIKKSYGQNVIIMTGNIANPEAYYFYINAKIDWVRCGIGTGAACITSTETGIHYPMASLLDEISDIREELVNDDRSNFTYDNLPKIIADGGIDGYSNINKALALGADAVMIGKLFAQCEEACGPEYWSHSAEHIEEGYYMGSESYNNIKDDIIDDLEVCLFKKFRKYKGMSTPEAQVAMGKAGNKTTEGITTYVEVKYPVKEFLGKAESYLRSAMSYTNSKTLEDFGLSEMIVLGGSSQNVYKK